MYLASIPSPGWSGFSIGGFTVHAYALCILAGIGAALWLTNRRWKARGGKEDHIWDIAIWAIPLGIIGGRLYHVFSSPDAYFGPDGDLTLIPQIWRGGLGIWGAVVLGVVGAYIGARRCGVRLPAFLDAAAPGILLAQGIGRWGNWFNQELFGAPTTLPWGLQIDYLTDGGINPNWPGPQYTEGTLFHPTFLYESIWNVIGVVLLLWLGSKFRLAWGQVFWAYVCYYTLGRVWIEALRIDDAELVLGLRLNVWTSILVFALGAAMFYLSRRKHREIEPSVYLPGREPATDSASVDESTTDSVDELATGRGDALRVASEPQLSRRARREADQKQGRGHASDG
ncbi:prolipoprotein diacylglyceryl transferase [Saxibacter everestensis]|uniref:Phosphatidylglycerol--prolipoprotein diacylglyceryl transferase n=1 Tax=Saxibacter everestensis TaxID=2909229 RepID=A0ABY8QXM5_9MICO|nr:prolipoprotein diacylglyceryl transferase [Brevibacteriaceae bacterium ZFBP1038]